MDLKVYTSVVKGLTLKVRKFWGKVPTFAEVTGKKVVGGGGGGGFPPTPTGIGLRVITKENLVEKQKNT